MKKCILKIEREKPNGCMTGGGYFTKLMIGEGDNDNITVDIIGGSNPDFHELMLILRDYTWFYMKVSKRYKHGAFNRRLVDTNKGLILETRNNDIVYRQLLIRWAKMTKKVNDRIHMYIWDLIDVLIAYGYFVVMDEYGKLCPANDVIDFNIDISRCRDPRSEKGWQEPSETPVLHIKGADTYQYYELPRDNRGLDTDGDI